MIVSRPVELTSVVLSSLVPWSDPPVEDFQFGEWQRGELAHGSVPQPRTEPDLAILLASAHSSSMPLRGPPLTSLIEPVPGGHVRRAIHDALPGLLLDLEGDERNVLLTLARMTVTLESGAIVSKDEAAQRVARRCSKEQASVLRLARQGYLGQAVDDWATLTEQVRSTADHLASRVRALRKPLDRRRDYNSASSLTTRARISSRMDRTESKSFPAGSSRLQSS